MKELAATLSEPLTLVDVGVRWGFEPRWAALVPSARLIGFDADEAECERLRASHRDVPGVTFAAAALSDREGQARLHLTEEPASSSLFEPDAELIARRRGMETMREVARTTIATTTLEAWARTAGVGWIDGLKLDVQGAELAILRGAGALLDGVRVLDLEVEFNPIYRSQPLFADVDAFLRERGFALWRLGELTHYGLPGAGRAGTVTERQTFSDGPLRPSRRRRPARLGPRALRPRRGGRPAHHGRVGRARPRRLRGLGVRARRRRAGGRPPRRPDPRGGRAEPRRAGAVRQPPVAAAHPHPARLDRCGAPLRPRGRTGGAWPRRRADRARAAAHGRQRAPAAPRTALVSRPGP